MSKKVPAAALTVGACFPEQQKLVSTFFVREKNAGWTLLPAGEGGEGSLSPNWINEGELKGTG